MAAGKKTGGRQKGTPNKVTAAIVAEVAASGETPKDYMLRVMRDEGVDATRRDAMAKAVAPFCHPHLANITATHEAGDSLADLLKELDGRTRGLPTSG